MPVINVSCAYPVVPGRRRMSITADAVMTIQSPTFKQPALLVMARNRRLKETADKAS